MPINHTDLHQFDQENERAGENLLVGTDLSRTVPTNREVFLQILARAIGIQKENWG